MLGLTTSHIRTETLFSVPSASFNEVTQGYLLALVNGEDDCSLIRVQDKIENNLHAFLPVTVIVLSCARFQGWLLNGHPFACSVAQKGFLLYQKDASLLPQATAVDEEAVQKEATQLFLQTERKVRELLAGAELYTVRVQHGLAAFLLHQAAEQTLRTMLIIHTGLRLNTHNLDKLLRCCTMFCPDLHDVFPRRSEGDKRLFGLLQKAYIDARYSGNYRIRFEELTTLTGKVKQLQELFKGWRPIRRNTSERE